MRDTLVLFASSRPSGNTRSLVNQISQALTLDVIDLETVNISAYDYEHKNIDDDFLSIIDQILVYKNVIFASPIYWYSTCAQMKVFIDRTSDLLDVEHLKPIGRKLRGKNTYIACTSISDSADESFMGALIKTFDYLGMTYCGAIHANCGNGYIEDEYQADINEFVSKITGKLD